MSRVILGVLAWSLPAAALAIPVSIDFSGGNLDIREFPSGSAEFAPLFDAARSVTGSITFDTDQPDVDLDPDVGTYRIGSLSVEIPEIGLVASRTSDSMQISSFNDVPNAPPNDEFFAFADEFDTFASGVGLPEPVWFWVALYGDTSMLQGDQLPTSALDWTGGNASFTFMGSDQTRRQVLVVFYPTDVPEPTSAGLLALGLAAMAFSRFRRRL